MIVPDRLSIDKKSPYYDKAVLDRKPRVLVNGVQQSKVAEYCISEGWVYRVSEKVNHRKGEFFRFKSHGVIDVSF